MRNGEPSRSEGFGRGAGGGNGRPEKVLAAVRKRVSLSGEVLVVVLERGEPINNQRTSTQTNT